MIRWEFCIILKYVYMYIYLYGVSVCKIKHNFVEYGIRRFLSLRLISISRQNNSDRSQALTYSCIV